MDDDMSPITTAYERFGGGTSTFGSSGQSRKPPPQDALPEDAMDLEQDKDDDDASVTVQASSSALTAMMGGKEEEEEGRDTVADEDSEASDDLENGVGVGDSNKEESVEKRHAEEDQQEDAPNSQNDSDDDLSKDGKEEASNDLKYSDDDMSQASKEEGASLGSNDNESKASREEVTVPTLEKGGEDSSDSEDEADDGGTNKDDDPPEEDEDDTPTDESPEGQEVETETPKESDEPTAEPDLEDVKAATERLFDQVEDKATVTVGDIFQSLAAKFNCDKFPKHIKKAVRDCLVELMSAVANEESEAEVDADDESDDEEEEQEENNSPNKKSRRRRPPPRRRPKPSKKLRETATALRKKRLAALRVRNEELQSAADQERVSTIAAKFETQTDEQVQARRETHEQLVNKLLEHRKRSLQEVIQVDPPAVVVKSEAEGEEARDKDDLATKNEPVSATKDETGDVSSSDDDDMELEIVGFSKPVFSLLVAPKQPKHRTNAVCARAALRQQLRSKQRHMGNRWLAQELGYNTATEHLKDCVALEQLKRKKVWELETTPEHYVQGAMEEEDEAEYDDDDDEETALAKKLSASQGDDNEDKEELESSQHGENISTGSQELTPPSSGQANEDEDKEHNTDGEAVDSVEPKDGCQPVPTRIQEPDANCLQPALETQPPEDVLDKAVLPPEGSSDEATTMHLECPPGPHTLESPQSEAANSKSEDSGGTAEGSSESQGRNVTFDIAPAESVGKPTGDGEDTDEEAQLSSKEAQSTKSKGPRNSAWKAMLKRDAELAKRMKRRKNGLVDDEADEEEEEEVAGLEDFGFKVLRKEKKNDDEEEAVADADEDDLENVVDDLSDNEGDEEAGESARKVMEQKEEKERHKAMIRRMRDGYDGRRGGIAGGGSGARGLHRLDQLTAAEDRETAKRLGLLNDDELDSDDEAGDQGEVDDEVALVDKMLKDRFLHRSSVEVEEHFSDNEELGDFTEEGNVEDTEATREEREQERLAKRFSKRAQMQRLMEAHGHDDEFSRSRLIDEDESMKTDLGKMKNGLARKRREISVSSSSNSSTQGAATSNKKQKTNAFGSVFGGGCSLGIALKTNRLKSSRTSFTQSEASSQSSIDVSGATQTTFGSTLSFKHVVFQDNSQSKSSFSAAPVSNMPAPRTSTRGSLWSKAVVAGFGKRRKF